MNANVGPVNANFGAPLANARMYSVTPAAAEAWRAVIGWATRAAGVPVEFVEHAPPKLLSDLWARDLRACLVLAALQMRRWGRVAVASRAGRHESCCLTQRKRGPVVRAGEPR